MPDDIGMRLSGTRFTDVRWVDETGSTNADAAALARDGAPEGVVLVADHQTAGRGRLGRSWQAPPGASLLTTVLLRPPVDRVDLVLVAVSTSMAEAVRATSGVEARIKWPNDLVVDDRKLAGVLAEVEWLDGNPTVCAGIGVNCNWPEDVPGDLRGTLVALNHLTGSEVDRGDLLVAFLAALEDRYSTLDRGALLDEWRARSATIGQPVRVEVGGDVVEGMAADITDEGHLLVAGADGSMQTFAVGDVTHLRHA